MSNPAVEQTSTGGFWDTFLTPSKTTVAEFQKAAPFMAVMGAVNGAIGSYYSAKSQQYQLESQASSLKFQSDLSKINAGVAESAAQQTMLAGERQIGQLSMRAGKLRSARRASTAARGIALDEGSTAEVAAGEEWAKQFDMMTISANTVRAAEAQRMQATNYSNQGLLQGVSAANMASSASTISPWLSVGSSLLGSATAIGSSWYSDRKLKAIADKLGIE